MKVGELLSGVYVMGLVSPGRRHTYGSVGTRRRERCNPVEMVDYSSCRRVGVAIG